jgi:hypothetical protein
MINDEEGGVDMCKKLVVALMMLSLASYAYAFLPNEVVYHADFDDTMVSSFEEGMDGWVVQNIGGNTANSATPGVYSTGATDGFYSLKLTTPDAWWNEAMYIDLGAIEGGKDVVLGNNTLSIDMAWLGSDNTGASTSGWAQNPLIRLLVNPDLGWAGNWWQSNPEVGLNTGAFDYGIGNWYTGIDGAQTVSWNYQDITAGKMNSNSAQYKFILEIVHVTGLPTTALYLDNVRFSGDGYVEYTPEPTTIALLGLGSLALLRRKK